MRAQPAREARAAGKPVPVPNFRDLYGRELDKYIAREGEEGLGRAYELGRTALQQGHSLLELVAAHHAAVRKIVRESQNPGECERLLKAAGAFLAESASPYEMAHRGFRDGIVALRQLNETLESEIKRVAHAVHDEAGQLLVSVHLALADFARELPSNQQEKIAAIRELLNRVERQIRRFSHELRPTILDDLGWFPAIEFLCQGVAKRANLAIRIETSVKERLPNRIEVALYRMIQEALTNVTKHANASEVRIRVRRNRGVLSCSVRDDGAGIQTRPANGSARRKGLGLLGIRERLNALGGTLQIDSARGRGTRLSFRIPLEEGNENQCSNGG